MEDFHEFKFSPLNIEKRMQRREKRAKKRDKNATTQ